MSYPEPIDTLNGRPPIEGPPPADTPPAVAELVLAYENELDALHPGWRRYEPFAHFDYDSLARVKWLLKRRQLLLHREWTAGRNGSAPTSRAAPRDWKVRIIPSPKSPRMCFAHPVIPEAVRRTMTDQPPSPIGLGLTISTPHPTGSSVIPWDTDNP